MAAHRYNFDLLTAARFRELIDQYGRIAAAGGDDAARGQQFNELVAELLRCWGLERVQANVRSVGEIDVTFAMDGTRFLLEAKWQQAPVSFDPIAKLSRRITQRLAGTRGVCLSMSGYTADATDPVPEQRTLNPRVYRCRSAQAIQQGDTASAPVRRHGGTPKMELGDHGRPVRVQVRGWSMTGI